VIYGDKKAVTVDTVDEILKSFMTAVVGARIVPYVVV